MIIKNLTEEQAKIISVWKYSDEYAIYNNPNWQAMKIQNYAITDENKRREQFRIILNNEIIVGYFRFYKKNEKILLGISMNPILCGQGNGKKFMQKILSYDELKNNPIQLEVRTFNKRAISCYKSVGFKIIEKVWKETPKGINEFYIMRLDNY